MISGRRTGPKNMPPHHEFDHEIHIENDQMLLIATSTHSLAPSSVSFAKFLK